MAEATLKRIPDPAELLENQPAELKGPDKVSSSLPPPYLAENLEDAERLLSYAAEAGIEVDAKVRDDVLNARIAGAGKWSEQTAGNVLSALTSLAAELKPVTAESLKVCAKQELVNNTIRSYKKVAIWLAVFIIPFSLATFITSAISEAIRKDIETANTLAVKLGDELRSTLAQKSKGEAQGRTEILPRDLQEFAAIIRSIDARAWQLNLFVAYTIADPFERTWWDIWSKKRDNTLKQKFELPPGIPDFTKATTDKIGVYQDVRYFAQSTREAVSTSIGAMATCVLPVLYALLGACAYLLRSIEEQFKHRTFNPPDVHIARFLIAAIGGAVVGLFNNFNISQNASIPPLAIAFLVGYAADVFFSFLESLLQTFTRRGNPASPTHPAARGSGS